jgi:N utilization substance protein B
LLGRRQAREAVLKTLFQIELGGAKAETALRTVLLEDKLSVTDTLFAREVTNGVVDRRDELDLLLQCFSGDWTVERMATMDRLILRMACYEILYRSDIPVAVSINEAIELAKKYSGEEASRFVNGILSAVARANTAKEGPH